MSDDLITFHRNTAWTPMLYTDGFPIVFTKITRAGLLLYLTLQQFLATGAGLSISRAPRQRRHGPVSETLLKDDFQIYEIIRVN